MRPSLSTRLASILVWLLTLLMVSARAEATGAASDWVQTDHSAVRLIAAVETVAQSDAVTLGLQFKLANGWKIYWRSPGDAGDPPRIDWSGSDNLAAAEVLWPLPMRFSVLGFETVGYGREVVLPIAAKLTRTGEGVRLRAAVDYLTCAEVCVPQSAHLNLALPVGLAEPSAYASLIARYTDRVPGAGEDAGLSLTRAEVVGAGSATRLRIVAQSKAPFSHPDVFVEGPEGLGFGAPRVELRDNGLQAVLEVPVIGTETSRTALAGQRLTATLVDGDRGAEQILPVTVGDAGEATTASPQPSLGWILAAAVLGGLILNLMPCVLPVLSIKLLSVLGHGGGEPRTVRLTFLATAAGILASFLILAGALVTLRSVGAAVSWGLQFQQPWFLTTMTLVMVLFACNLWGFFEIRLPGVIANAGERTGHVRGLGGHFLTGALATLLATPCSAPFLGTAIGFALSRGVGEIFVVFSALAIGLAAPYLAVAWMPTLATTLPRPGPWMRALRRALGFALAATALWLLTVLEAQVGHRQAIVIGGLAVAMGLALCLRSRLPGHLGRVGGGVAATLALAAFLVLSGSSGGGERSQTAFWIPFHETAIPQLVADGRVVLVNVTADWCLTCKVNESLVLARDPVRTALKSDRVIAMQADWTRPNDSIARYLARFGRYGIPFDVVYGPGRPDGEALPELLSATAVLTALDRAAGGQTQAAR